MKKYILLLIVPFLGFGQTTESFLPICNIDMKTDFSGDNVSMSIPELKLSRGLYVSKHPQSLEDASFNIIEYSVSYIDKFGHERLIAGVKGNKFNEDRIVALFHALKSGEKILFYNIKAQKYIKGTLQADLISLKNITITIKEN